MAIAAGIATGASLLPWIAGMFGKDKKRDIRSKEEKRLDKMRSQLQESALGKMIGQLSGMDREDFVKRRMTDFERTTAPKIAETAAATSGLRGSDYLSALSGAATQAEQAAEGDFFDQLNEMLTGAGQQKPTPGTQKFVPGVGGEIAKGLGPLAQQMGGYGAMGLADYFSLPTSPGGVRGQGGGEAPPQERKSSDVGGGAV